MDSDGLEATLAKLIGAIGEKEVQKLLTNRLEATLAKSRTLTIICDETMHAIPERVIVGDRYVFSREPLELSSAEELERQLESRISDLAAILKGRKYNRYRVVYSGHAILGSLVKHLIYRVTHKECEDVIYFGSSGYFTVKLNTRAVVSKSSAES